MHTMTLQDVADLAKVRRPVVSMWRKRPKVRGVSMPFPNPVGVTAGTERFASDEVVDYLQRTGRGNNPDMEYDAPAVAVPDGADLEDVVILLGWHVLTGQELADSTAEQRIRLASAFDPDDAVLLREIRNLRPTVELLRYVDDLVEASFGPADALARVEMGRLRRELAPRDLTTDAVALLGSVTDACVVSMGGEGLALRTDGSVVSLAVAARASLPVVSHDRAVLRRAVITGLGMGDSRARATTFASVIGLDPAQVLDRADELVLGLNNGEAAVIVGPAAALADVLTGELQHRRAAVLRVGNVVAALRLPRGMWREAHRQSLALWVCLGGADAQRPWVADLASADNLELGDLAADVAGALAQTENRAFRYARRIELAGVLAAGAFVPRGTRASTLRSADPVSHLDRVHAATLTTTTPLDTLDVLVDASPGRLRLRHRSLGEMRDQQQLILKRGNRINAADASPDGSVPVLPVEIAGDIALDPFDAEQKYRGAVRTDPGDVIFVERPRPRAWVDPQGGAMVASPARILRLGATAEFGPRMLATIINETAPVGSEWQTWTVPTMSRDEATRLEDALVAVEQYEADAIRRADAARDLKKALIDGVAAGALTLDAKGTTPGVAAVAK